MSDCNAQVTAEPITDLVRKIELAATKADDHVIDAAMHMRELRRRIEGGEAGENVKWYEWAKNNIKLSTSRLYELQSIAEADDPKAELERLRGMIRERVKKSRGKKAAEKNKLEEEREALIAIAKSASLEEVRAILHWHNKRTAMANTTAARETANDDIVDAA